MLDVAIIGGGPAGLATAIECGRKGLSHVVLEKGALVDAIRRFPVNMVFLSSMGIEMDSGSGKPNVNPATCETNVPGIYLAGGVVAGRENNKIFIENGRFHGKKIVKHVAGS